MDLQEQRGATALFYWVGNPGRQFLDGDYW